MLLIILMITGIDFVVSWRNGVPFQMLARDNCVLVLLGAVIVFMMVMQMKPHYVGWVNQLASYVFPIYVIQSVLHERAFFPEEANVMLYMIVWLNAIAISIAALLMEYIRRLLLGKPFAWITRIEGKIITAIKNNVINLGSMLI